ESAWSVTVPMWNEPGVPERNTHCAVTEGYHRGTRGTVNGGLSSLAQVMDIRHPDEMAGSAGEGRGVSRAGTRGDHASRPTFRRAGPVADRLGPDTPQPRGARRGRLADRATRTPRRARAHRTKLAPVRQ